MNARENLQAMVRTDRGGMTVWSPSEVRNALDAYRAEVLAEAPVTVTDSTPIPLRWDRLVMHPDGSQDDQTIVCCLTDDGRPAALFLDDEYREALGGILLDPNPDDEAATP